MTADGTGAPETGTAADTELARAKVNLFLHVRGRRADGYHLLESLAVFPALGDLLTVEPGAGLSLAVSGPFAGDLGAGADNLVIRAAEALRDATGTPGGAALMLRKNLPVASGIGGGSADAAAALRLLARHWGVTVPAGTGIALGADVPVCEASTPCMMAGIGETLTPAPALPPFWIVLANPLVGVPTGKVFGALERRDNPAGPEAPAGGFADLAGMAEWLRAQRNDLEAPAAAICPEIGAVTAALAAEGAALARMSGSGATCFGLFADEATALAAADAIRRAAPGWWVAAAPV